MDDVPAELPRTDSADIAALLEGRREFLRFLEKRVESRAVAEEILQNAFLKTVERPPALESEENAVAWFYSVLRHAVIDHYRRRDVERRGLEKETLLLSPEIDETARGDVCACMRHLLPTLKTEYAQIIDQVDLKERSLADVAAEVGISVNNATVRLHRARQSLKGQLERSCGACATHGCLDCDCGQIQI